MRQKLQIPRDGENLSREVKIYFIAKIRSSVLQLVIFSKDTILAYHEAQIIFVFYSDQIRRTQRTNKTQFPRTLNGLWKSLSIEGKFRELETQNQGSRTQGQNVKI